MPAPPAVIAALNKMLFNELTAINGYFLHARMMRHWGFKALGERNHQEPIGEMRYADKLTERILMLDGLPNFQAVLHIAGGRLRGCRAPPAALGYRNGR
jgi:bacterioferritin